MRFRDGIGVRIASADAFGEPIEQLQLCTDIAALESAVRERVSRLINFRHVRYVRLRGSERLTNPTKDVVVTYDAVPGTRLSEFLELALHAPLRIDIDTALLIVRELLPAIAVLHDSRNVTHGAIGPERLVLTPQGRLVIVDHGLGLALGKLGYSRKRFWTQLRVPVPQGTGKVVFDARTDVIQIGMVALALILGRPIEEDEFPQGLEKLLDSAKETPSIGSSRPLSNELRAWLDRALPLEKRVAFATVREAQQEFEKLFSGTRYGANSNALKALVAKYAAVAQGKAPVEEVPVAAAPEPIGAPIENPIERALGSDRRREALPPPLVQPDGHVPQETEVAVTSLADAVGLGPKGRLRATTIRKALVTPLTDPVSRSVSSTARTAASAGLGGASSSTSVSSKSLPSINAKSVGVKTPALDAKSVSIGKGDAKSTIAATTADVKGAGAKPDAKVADANAAQKPAVKAPIAAAAEVAALEEVMSDTYTDAQVSIATKGTQAAAPAAPASNGKVSTSDVDAQSILLMDSVDDETTLVPASAFEDATPDVDRFAGMGGRSTAQGIEVNPAAKGVEAKTPDARVADVKVTDAKSPAPAIKAPAPAAKAPAVKTSGVKTADVKPAEPKAPALRVEVKAPEVKAPAAKAPEVKAPAVNAPEVVAPAAKVPSTSAPAASDPAVNAPAAKAPTVNVPPTAVPVAGGPAVNAPAAKMPTVNVPPTSVPAAGGPLVNAPAAKTPAANVPAINVPAATIPAPNVTADAPLFSGTPMAPVAPSAKAAPPAVPPAVVPPAAKIPLPGAPVAQPVPPAAGVPPKVSVPLPSAVPPAATPLAPAASIATPSEAPFVALPMSKTPAPQVTPVAPPSVAPPLVATTPVAMPPVATTPVTAASVVATPVPPTPVTPAPAAVTPVVAAPVAKAPVTAPFVAPIGTTEITVAPVVSTPVAPALATPAPAAVGPVVAAPVAKAPVTAPPLAAPVVSSPVAPTLATPAPVAVGPVVAAPVAKAPVTAPPLAAPVVSSPVAPTLATPAPAAVTPVVAAPSIAMPALPEPELFVETAPPVVIEEPAKKKSLASKLWAAVPKPKKAAPPVSIIAVPEDYTASAEAPAPAAASTAVVQDMPGMPATMPPAAAGTVTPVTPPAPIAPAAVAPLAPAARVTTPSASPTSPASTAPAVPSSTQVVAPTAAKSAGFDWNKDVGNTDAVPAWARGRDASSDEVQGRQEGPVDFDAASGSLSSAVNAASASGPVSAFMAAPKPVVIKPEKPESSTSPSPSSSSAASSSSSETRTLLRPGSGFFADAAPDAEPEPEKVVAFKAPRRQMPRIRINWRRTLAASLVVSLFEGVAFATAYWYVIPAETGSLLVETTPAGIEILVDGRLKGRTPFSDSLTPGRHTIELRQGANSRVLPVEISSGVQTMQRITWAKGLQTGQARVTATAPNARVTIDGKNWGKAPLTISTLAAGKHMVQIESDAGTVSTPIAVSPGETTELDVPIFPGWVSVLAPVQLFIYEGERFLGTTEGEKLMLAPGKHKLDFVSEELGFKRTHEVTVTPGATVAVSLPMPKVAVAVEGPDGADLIVDGEAMGKLPLTGLQVPLGTRDFVVKHPDHGEKRQVVTVTTHSPMRVVMR